MSTPAKAGAEGGAALAQAGGDAAAGAGDGDAVYGSSYTGRRTRELELLHDIVRQTRGAFIDVSRRQQTADVAEDGAERSERSGAYSRQIRQQQQQQQQQTAAAVPSSALAAAAASSSLLPSSSSLLSAHPVIPSPFSLPAAPASSSVASALAAVKAAGLTAADRDWLRRRAGELTRAMEALQLPDAGTIVLSFDQL